MRKSRQRAQEANGQKPTETPVVNLLEGNDLIDLLAPAAMDFTVPDCCAFGPAELGRM
jgi:hypothetical protein